ncbi:MAG: NUDIX domain-containing protein [Cyanobacteria bacterium P01_D01_bin.105]
MRNRDQQIIEVTMAILYREKRFLMQLRDDFEHIIYPGVWGFFGGHIEIGENPTVGIERELMEELGYVPPKLALFSDKTENGIRRYFYHGELTVPVSKLQLNEGQDLGLCSIDEIKKGEKYSQRLGEVRSLGEPHQQALLDFLDSSWSG